MKTIRVPAGLALALAFTAALAAQTSTSTTTAPTPPTPAQLTANQVARLTTLLTLTTDQQTQATTIFTAEYTALSTIQTSLQTERTTLNRAVTANDTAGIAAAASEIGTLTGQQVLAQATASAAFLLILTTDQQTKYEALQTSGGGRGPGQDGPGGPGHGPGGPH